MAYITSMHILETYSILTMSRLIINSWADKLPQLSWFLWRNPKHLLTYQLKLFNLVHDVMFYELSAVKRCSFWLFNFGLCQRTQIYSIWREAAWLICLLLDNFHFNRIFLNFLRWYMYSFWWQAFFRSYFFLNRGFWMYKWGEMCRSHEWWLFVRSWGWVSWWRILL